MAEINLLYSYPKAGFYYYYISDLKPETFKKPQEVKHIDGTYHIFIYNKKLDLKTFQQFTHNIPIEDEPGQLFEMLSVGIKNKPQYYLIRTLEYGSPKVDFCKLQKNNDQVKYTLNEEGNLVKQMKFNNGELGITSICNPDYIPEQDI